MNSKKQTYQSDLVWEPSPEINWIDKVCPEEDGVNLPNSVTEDVRGFSLCPPYSKKQLRRINRIRSRTNSACCVENPNWPSWKSKSIHENKHVLLRTYEAEVAQL
jgi:hypothetical protein